MIWLFLKPYTWAFYKSQYITYLQFFNVFNKFIQSMDIFCLLVLKKPIYQYWQHTVSFLPLLNMSCADTKLSSSNTIAVLLRELYYMNFTSHCMIIILDSVIALMTTRIALKCTVTHKINSPHYSLWNDVDT